MRERYDPNSPVCQNQDDFNQAIQNAVKYNNDQAYNESKPWLVAYVIIWLIFSIWAIMLAMKLHPGSERVEHVVFAFVFGPVYVISHYLSNSKLD